MLLRRSDRPVRTASLTRPSAPPTPYVRPEGYAEHYRDRRFAIGSGPRTHRREARAIRALLATAAPGASPTSDVRPWLDAPSGTGRLSDLLPGPVVQVDRHAPMLAACPGDAPRIAASVHELPFADAAFAGVLCHRLFHHLPTPDERVAVLRELARVTDGPILLSFFHAGSVQHLRRTVRRRFGKTRSGRVAVSLRQMLRDADAAGLRLAAARPLLPLISEQWVVRLEAHDRADHASPSGT